MGTIPKSLLQLPHTFTALPTLLLEGRAPSTHCAREGLPPSSACHLVRGLPPSLQGTSQSFFIFHHPALCHTATSHVTARSTLFCFYPRQPVLSLGHFSRQPLVHHVTKADLLKYKWSQRPLRGKGLLLGCLGGSAG